MTRPESTPRDRPLMSGTALLNVELCQTSIGLPPDRFEPYMRPLHSFATGSDTFDTVILSGLSRAAREATISQMASDAIAISLGEFDSPQKQEVAGLSRPMDQLLYPKTFSWVKSATSEEFRRRAPLDGIIRAGQAHFGPEMFRERSHIVLPIGPKDKKTLYADWPRIAEVRLEDAAKRLRSRGMTAEPTLESFSAYVGVFDDIATVEASATALSYLRILGRLGPQQAERAQAIGRELGPRFHDDTGQTAHTCLRLTAGELIQSRDNLSNNPQAKRIDRVLSKLILGTYHIPEDIAKHRRMFKQTSRTIELNEASRARKSKGEQGVPSARPLPPHIPESIRALIEGRLYEVILPTERNRMDAETFGRQLRSHVAKLMPRHTSTAQKYAWERLEDLAGIAMYYDGRLYMADRDILGGNAEPFFICLFSLDGRQYGLAESPLHGNATYVAEGDAWLEILKLNRDQARLRGAVKLVHPTVKDDGSHRYHHTQRVHDTISQLHTGSL